MFALLHNRGAAFTRWLSLLLVVFILYGTTVELFDKIDFQRGRVRPRTILDFSIGADLMQKQRVSLNLQFDIQNLTNQLFL